MYAVFRSGGKQYRAAKGDVLRLEKLEAEEGATIDFDEVLLVGEGADVNVGSPVLAGSVVSGTVLRQGKSRKVPVVKFRRRQNYLRQGTHRQFFTEVEITAISHGGVKVSGDEPAVKKVAKKKAVTKKAATKKTATKKVAAKAASAAAPKKTAAKKTAKKKAAKK